MLGLRGAGLRTRGLFSFGQDDVVRQLHTFGTDVDVDNRVLSLEEIHSFSNTSMNQLRLGYNFIARNELPRETLRDADLGM